MRTEQAVRIVQEIRGSLNVGSDLFLVESESLPLTVNVIYFGIILSIEFVSFPGQRVRQIYA